MAPPKHKKPAPRAGDAGGGCDKPAPRAPDDPRFARIATDPRFARFPKAKGRVEVDDRFKAMLHDPAFQTAAAVDKRGRGRAAKKAPPPAADDAADAADAAAAERWARARGLAGPDTSSSSSSESESDDASTSNGDGSDSSSSSSSSSSDGNDVDSGPDDATLAAEFGPGALAANPDEPVPDAPAVTRRLAVVDLDWDRTRAVDVLAALRSFAPASGRVERVTVYPSDYGLARLTEEERRGPAPLAVGGGGEAQDASDDNGARGDDEPDAVRLRAYERSRLRYYYAVVDTDAPATAARLVAECDGLEFGRTGAVFDLRYVPDDADFSARAVRDDAATVPPTYTPPDEVALATSHTRPETGWDADDGGRRRALAAAARGGRAPGRRATAEALRDDDFKAYLASDDSSDGDGGSDGDDAGAAAARYRALLAGGEGGDGPSTAAAPRAGGKAWARGDAPPRRTEGDLTVTFAGGLGALSTRLAARADEGCAKGGKAVWDAYLKARAAKRAARAAQGRRGGSSSDDDSDGGGGGADAAADAEPAKAGADPFDDPFFADDGADVGAAAAVAVDSEEEEGAPAPAKRRGGKGAAERAGAGGGGGGDGDDGARRRAQLELVALDDAALRAGVVPAAGEEGGGPLATAPRPPPKSRKARARERAAAKAAGRAADASDDDDGDGGRAADLADPRFGRLLSDPAYALDPTDPAFRRAGGSELATRVREAKKGKKTEHNDAPAKPAAAAPTDDGGLRAMVASLKRRAAAAGGDGGRRKAAREA